MKACSARLSVLGVAVVLAFGCVRETPPHTASPADPVEPAAVETPALVLPGHPATVAPSAAIPEDFAVSPEVEVYGNFETAGIVVQPGDAVPFDRIGRMSAFLNVAGQWQPVHDLVQVGAFPWYAGSLFWLQPDATYQVKVVVADRQGETLATYYGQGATRPNPMLPTTRRELFVAADGDDAQPGTREQPLRTLAKAFSLAERDLTIWLREGVYFEGDLHLPRSGEAGAPIVIRAWPGEAVVLDGSRPDLIDAARWTDEGGGVYSHAFEGQSQNLILRDRRSGERIRLAPLHTVDEVREGVVQDYGAFDALGLSGAYAWDGQTLFLRAPGPLADYDVHVGAATVGMRFDRKRHVYIDGLEFRHYGKEDYAGGVMVFDSSDVLIQNCRFTCVDTPIWVKMATHRLTVQDCEFTDTLHDWPFGLLKMGGALQSYEAGAIYVDAKFSGRGLVVRRNRIDGLFDGVHLTPWTEDDARTNEIDFYQNVVLNCVDDFIEIDGFSRNLRVFDNYMRTALTGISVAQALDGPTFCIYNVIADCGMVPATQREENAGYPVKSNGGPSADIGSGPMFFYHNTSYTLDPDSRAFFVKRPKWKKLVMQNNVWQGRALGFEIWIDPPSPMVLDYENVWVADTNAPLFRIAYRNNLYTLDEVRRKRFWLKNGISADPRIKDEVGGDYRLRDDSPNIDAGVRLAGINDLRTQGAAPDIGAYERR